MSWINVPRCHALWPRSFSSGSFYPRKKKSWKSQGWGWAPERERWDPGLADGAGDLGRLKPWPTEGGLGGIQWAWSCKDPGREIWVWGVKATEHLAAGSKQIWAWKKAGNPKMLKKRYSAWEKHTSFYSFTHSLTHLFTQQTLAKYPLGTRYCPSCWGNLKILFPYESSLLTRYLFTLCIKILK